MSIYLTKLLCLLILFDEQMILEYTSTEKSVCNFFSLSAPFGRSNSGNCPPPQIKLGEGKLEVISV